MTNPQGVNQAESWLVPDHSDRARMLDMDRRLQPIRRAAFAVLAVALIITGPWIGYWTLIPLAVAGILFAIADRRIDKVEKPEYGIFAAWTASVVIIAVCILLGGVAGLPSLAWFAIPVVTLSARFSYRGVALGVVIVLALQITTAFLTAPNIVAEAPPRLVMPVALVIAVAIFSTALMRSDREHRGKAVIDPLTGMLNRKALEGRLARAAPAVRGRGRADRADRHRHRPLQAGQRHRRTRGRRRRPHRRRLHHPQGPARLRARLPARRRGVPRPAARRRRGADPAPRDGGSARPCPTPASPTT